MKTRMFGVGQFLLNSALLRDKCNVPGGFGTSRGSEEFHLMTPKNFGLRSTQRQYASFRRKPFIAKRLQAPKNNPNSVKNSQDKQLMCVLLIE